MLEAHLCREFLVDESKAVFVLLLSDDTLFVSV